MMMQQQHCYCGQSFDQKERKISLWEKMQQKLMRLSRQRLLLGGTKMCSAKMLLRNVLNNLLLMLNVQAFRSNTYGL